MNVDELPESLRALAISRIDPKELDDRKRWGVMSAFTWGETPEGIKFWHRVHKMTEHLSGACKYKPLLDLVLEV